MSTLNCLNTSEGSKAPNVIDHPSSSVPPDLLVRLHQRLFELESKYVEMQSQIFNLELKQSNLEQKLTSPPAAPGTLPKNEGGTSTSVGGPLLEDVDRRLIALDRRLEQVEAVHLIVENRDQDAGTPLAVTGDGQLEFEADHSGSSQGQEQGQDESDAFMKAEAEPEFILGDESPYTMQTGVTGNVNQNQPGTSSMLGYASFSNPVFPVVFSNTDGSSSTRTRFTDRNTNRESATNRLRAWHGARVGRPPSRAGRGGAGAETRLTLSPEEIRCPIAITPPAAPREPTQHTQIEKRVIQFEDARGQTAEVGQREDGTLQCLNCSTSTRFKFMCHFKYHHKKMHVSPLS